MYYLCIIRVKKIKNIILNKNLCVYTICIFFWNHLRKIYGIFN